MKSMEERARRACEVAADFDRGNFTAKKRAVEDAKLDAFIASHPEIEGLDPFRKSDDAA